MPCLNEADTLETCIRKAKAAIEKGAINAEIIVADNGSTDGSIEIASRLGARVVQVSEKGYGNALMGGIAAARGTYVIMGDADDSYDFGEIPKFLEKLRAGHQLVQGCRLPVGGGTVLPEAMPFSHRWIGNPMFTAMVRTMFRAPIHDVYCGLRGFRKDLYDELQLRCTGMEFATEMIIKTSLFGKDIAEVPITLHPDGRTSHEPHLRTIRDGWRTFRFFLMYSPKWLYLIPGLLMIMAGILGYALALPAVRIFGATIDVHTLLVSSLSLLLGAQLLQLAMVAKTFAISEGLMPTSDTMRRFDSAFTLERGASLGLGMMAGGLTLIATVAWYWWKVNFGPIGYGWTMRVVVPGVTAVMLGFQVIAASFLISMLRLARR
jgi:glycosyltransferase involved in cell wall biosynthesis